MANDGSRAGPLGGKARHIPQDAHRRDRQRDGRCGGIRAGPRRGKRPNRRSQGRARSDDHAASCRRSALPEGIPRPRPRADRLRRHHHGRDDREDVHPGAVRRDVGNRTDRPCRADHALRAGSLWSRQPGCGRRVARLQHGDGRDLRLDARSADQCRRLGGGSGLFCRMEQGDRSRQRGGRLSTPRRNLRPESGGWLVLHGKGPDRSFVQGLPL
jgi:hypothetical protein